VTAVNQYYIVRCSLASTGVKANNRYSTVAVMKVSNAKRNIATAVIEVHDPHANLCCCKLSPQNQRHIFVALMKFHNSKHHNVMDISEV
jgi:hypothetical protein